MDSPDLCKRPLKRQKMDYSDLKSIPFDILLVSLPNLLAHPPTHRYHTRSLFLTLFALRKCLSLPNLDADVECRAWTELAEVGFRIGLQEPGLESEVGKAITKALMIANKHPTLRNYKPQLTNLSARLASYQSNHKLAQNTLKKVLTNFIISSDPPHVTYTAHLAYITSLSSISADDDSPPYSPSSASLKALSAIRDLHDLAQRNNHHEVVRLAMVLELRDLVQNGVWSRVSASLASNEEELGIQATSSDPAPPPKDIKHTNLAKALIVHVLIIGVIYYTYVGESANAISRLKQLHDMLDGGALDAFGTSGIVEVELPSSPPLRVQVTHPRVIYSLGFLVSSVSKRDPVGRKPKRTLFANEGILVVDRELKKEIPMPTWASIQDVKNFQDRMHKMKADMMCELIGVAISRSEYADAERHLAQVIAHTRTYNIFNIYSARITLHQAHLAHSQAQSERAIKCYRVAAYLSQQRSSRSEESDEQDDGCEDRWVNVSARAGELWLRVGLAGEEEDEAEFVRVMQVLRKEGKEVVKECQGLGGTIEAVGAVLEACLAEEFLVAKVHLRNALNFSTAAQDNHLRALVLALVAAQYVHTSTEHAETMLSTAEQLAAGLGAQPKAAPANATAGRSGSADNGKTSAAAPANKVGNAHLRLWIGERTLELKRRAGDDNAAAKQEAMNAKLRASVGTARKRKFGEVV
ncbi:hypothetical protein BDN70DRAFT_839938 [Pholiota conissans]|uniref:Uncharacterized protein n=1 Tax=Pholiota conissans TaxID=109636 RepID=A0A9P5YUT9_9AGAR|nr:hypothetical protein BDN70DRAFT_839938 [Pholiota conissans]